MILYLLVSGIAVLWWSLRDSFCCFFCLLLTLFPKRGTGFYLVTQKRMITWPVLSLLPSKYPFHANTTSCCCQKVCGLLNLTMPGETSGTATLADKPKLLWTVHYLHNCGWGWFGPCLSDTWFELFSSSQCQCRRFLSSPSQTFNSQCHRRIGKMNRYFWGLFFSPECLILEFKCEHLKKTHS